MKSIMDLVRDMKTAYPEDVRVTMADIEEACRITASWKSSYLKTRRLAIIEIAKNTPVEKDVHTEHCCKYHGCKYNDENCSVVKGEKRQSVPCESCSDEISEVENHFGGI